MLSKCHLSIAATFCLLCFSASIAQTTQLAGKVLRKNADGSVSPVAGATVQIYRTDVITKLPATTSDQNGNYAFSGLPFVGTYMLAVSGIGLKAEIYESIKPGKNLDLTVQSGNGVAFADQELRAYLEKVKLTKAKNAEIEKKNTRISTFLNEGSVAFRAKNYDLAIERFDQAIAVDPEFPGTATTLNNNKAAALRNRGVDTYNQSVKNVAERESLRAKAKSDLRNSLAASQRTLDLVGTVTDPSELNKYKEATYLALLNSVETRRLLIATALEMTELDLAAIALESYLNVETDAALRIKNQVLIADAFRVVGGTSRAIPIFRHVLAQESGNLDAIAGLAISLLNEAEVQSKPEMFRESLKLLERFDSLAPPTHPLKQEVQMSLRYLREEKKVPPKP